MKKLIQNIIIYLAMVFIMIFVFTMIDGLFGTEFIPDDETSDLVTSLIILIPVIVLAIYNISKYIIKVKNGVVVLDNSINESISNYTIFEETNAEMILTINEKIDSLIKQENLSFSSKMNYPTDNLVYVSHALSNFPELKSDKSIVKASEEITQRIADLRDQKTFINSNIKEFNVLIRKFPNSMFLKKIQEKEYI
ncbi:LemA family protein [Erysipelothrix sp. HDW6A]|uniref:LemA family protein n=1 Tax=Erysipelothrix sp. HDW6A TaxID=2714928 RepID=UPI001409A6D3|nr:LemA family protein [Erysipelothrix sp. HDW6A]QIK57342.1 LemA family protein [Erysipelothrix sp. HDW6A]